MSKVWIILLLPENASIRFARSIPDTIQFNVNQNNKLICRHIHIKASPFNLSRTNWARGLFHLIRLQLFTRGSNSSSHHQFTLFTGGCNLRFYKSTQTVELDAKTNGIRRFLSLVSPEGWSNGTSPSYRCFTPLPAFESFQKRCSLITLQKGRMKKGFAVNFVRSMDHH